MKINAPTAAVLAVLAVLIAGFVIWNGMRGPGDPPPIPADALKPVPPPNAASS